MNVANSRQDLVNIAFDVMYNAVRGFKVLGGVGSLVSALAISGAIAGYSAASIMASNLQDKSPSYSVPGSRIDSASMLSSMQVPFMGTRLSALSVASAPNAQVLENDELDSFPARVLSGPQKNLVKFITSKYSVDFNEAQEYVFQAFRAARDLRVDPLLILAVMSIESSFDADAQSHVGAQGLMQVLTRVHKEKFAPFGGTKSAFDPVVNIRVGTLILKQYIAAAGGSFERALKFYVGAALMPDDQGYGYKVLSERQRLEAAADGRPIPVIAPRRVVQIPEKANRPSSEPTLELTNEHKSLGGDDSARLETQEAV